MKGKKKGARKLRAATIAAQREIEIAKLRGQVDKYEAFFRSLKEIMRIDRSDVLNLED